MINPNGFDLEIENLDKYNISKLDDYNGKVSIIPCFENVNIYEETFMLVGFQEIEAKEKKNVYVSKCDICNSDINKLTDNYLKLKNDLLCESCVRECYKR